MLTIEDPSKIVWKDMPLLDVAMGNYQDVYYTLKLFHRFKEDLEKLGTWKLYQTCFAELNTVCANIEVEGMSVDLEELDKVKVKLTDLLNKAYDDFNAALGENKINAKSHKDMKGLFYLDEDGLQLYPPVRSKKTGEPSCNREALEQLEMFIEEELSVRKEN